MDKLLPPLSACALHSLGTQSIAGRKNCQGTGPAASIDSSIMRTNFVFRTKIWPKTLEISKNALPLKASCLDMPASENSCPGVALGWCVHGCVFPKQMSLTFLWEG